MNHCLQPTTASNCHVVSRVPYSLKVLKASNFFFTFTRRKSETVRPCKMSTLPCYSDLYNFTQAGSQARRMTWKRLRS